MRIHYTPLSTLPLLLALATSAIACGDSDTTTADTATDVAPDTTAVDADTTPGDAVADAGADAVADAGADATGPPTLALHYHRADGAYAGWTAHVTGGVEGGAIDVNQGTADGFGAVFEVPLADGATAISYDFRDGDGALDPEVAWDIVLSEAPDGVWHFSGAEAPRLSAPPAIPAADQLVVHYLRDDDSYAGWGAHVWEDVANPTSWQVPLSAGGVDPDFGAWYVVDLLPAAAKVGLIIHKGDDKDPGPDMFIAPAETGNMVFLTTGSVEIAPYPVAIPEFAIKGAAAHWVDAETIAWKTPPNAVSYELRYAADASVVVEGVDVTGGTVWTLTADATGLTPPQRAAWPHLRDFGVLKVASGDLAAIPIALKGKLVVVARDAAGEALAATAVQIPGVLDDLFTYEGDLGVTFDGGVPSFAVWAPTAQSVTLERADSSLTPVETVSMTEGADGVWRFSAATAAWVGDHYRFAVTVYHPVSGKVESVTVTDPYSVALSANSAWSLVADLSDATTRPSGWDARIKAAVDAPEDIVVYEGHIRDFSAWDTTVPEAARGTYGAFNYNGVVDALSDGMGHLKALAQAGLTHFHVLPAFDIATVNEDRAARVDVNAGVDALCAANGSVPATFCSAHGSTPIATVLAGFDPASGDAQQLVTWMAGLDGFNWGYDPFHYSVPEGSYATTADGLSRVIEFRKMVMALDDIGLRLALDVVYNHTNAAGLGDKSVLDKLVPGYYHRLNVETGQVETSTCCANTASEHAMMRRLMVDSLVLWARHYKIDAFRFDLMGHHMKADMLAVRAALDALTVAADGVDGAGIYLYGEGWNFGEVANNQRGTNATQLNLAGTGIGTFNDRIRDAARGGSAFDSADDLRANQGLINGVGTDRNASAPVAATATAKALELADITRISLAGNLTSFKITNRDGNVRTGFLIGYNGDSAGYTSDPQESMPYVSKHDNQTLFDINAYKAKAGTSMADRVRMQNLGIDLTALAQGVPFFHMGVDLLRSKSMERDSYDSGDWFNRVDFSAQTTNWNVGLPNAEKDMANWPTIQSVLADTTIVPTAADIAAASGHFREMLQIRASSPLFRLRTGAAVKTRVHFHNTGPSQIVGMLAWTITDAACAGDDLDANYDGVFNVFNGTPTSRDITLTGAAAGWQLHPVQQASADSVVQSASYASGTGTFSVPARTTAVFVLPQTGAQGAGPGCNPL